MSLLHDPPKLSIKAPTTSTEQHTSAGSPTTSPATARATSPTPPQTASISLQTPRATRQASSSPTLDRTILMDHPRTTYFRRPQSASAKAVHPPATSRQAAPAPASDPTISAGSSTVAHMYMVPAAPPALATVLPPAATPLAAPASSSTSSNPPSSTPTTFPKYLGLPAEVQQMIAFHLSLPAYSRLLRTSHQTHALLAPLLNHYSHTLAIRATLHLPLGPWRTPLHVAAAHHDHTQLTSLLKTLLSRYGAAHTARILNRPDTIRLTPLHSAVLSRSTASQREKTVRILIEHGARAGSSCLRAHDDECSCGLRCQVPPVVWCAGLRGDKVVEKMLLKEGGVDVDDVFEGEGVWRTEAAETALMMWRLQEGKWYGRVYVKRRECPGVERFGGSMHTTDNSMSNCGVGIRGGSRGV